MDVIALAREKLGEVDYFMLLLSYSSVTNKSVLNGTNFKNWAVIDGKIDEIPPPPIENEIGFLFSAFLNAAYGALEYLKREKRLAGIVREFRAEHKNLYASGPKGGYRTITTHFSPIVPKRTPLKAGPDDQAIEDMLIACFGESVETVETKENPTKYFYLEEFEPQDQLFSLCTRHAMELTSFICRCETIVKSPTL